MTSNARLRSTSRWAMRRWIEDQLDRDYVRTRIAEQLDIPFTEVRDVIDLLVEAVLSP